MKTLRIVMICLAVAVSVHAAEPPAMAPEMLAQMARANEFSKPGPAHRRLDPLVGTWNNTLKMWMAPNAEPMVLRGTNTSRWILNGRQIETKHRGMMFGKLFEGVGYIGYDNVREEYTMVWMDNMGTGTMTATGEFEASTNSITEEGTHSCPMTGERDKTFRGAWRMMDKNRYIYEMYSHDENGREYKSMEIEYTRKSRRR